METDPEKVLKYKSRENRGSDRNLSEIEHIY